MVNHKHKFIFLHIPKTGGMSIGNALHKSYGIEENYESFYIHYDNLNETILKDYFVFTFVRNPWDRLTSNYRFKKKISDKFSFDKFLENTEECYENIFNTSVKEKDINKFNSIEETATYYGEFIHTTSQVEFLKGKYGEWILYDPEFNKNTYFLWLLPILIFLLGGAIIFKLSIFRKK